MKILDKLILKSISFLRLRRRLIRLLASNLATHMYHEISSSVGVSTVAIGTNKKNIFGPLSSKAAVYSIKWGDIIHGYKDTKKLFGYAPAVVFNKIETGEISRGLLMEIVFNAYFIPLEKICIKDLDDPFFLWADDTGIQLIMTSEKDQTSWILQHGITWLKLFDLNTLEAKV